MAVAVGIRDYFLANPTLAALIGERFFPHEAAHEAVAPYVVYSLHDFFQVRDLQGNLGKRHWTYELKCCGDSYASALACRDAVKAAIVGTETEDLDGTSCSLFWAQDSEHDSHASAVDKSRFQLSIDLEILER